jgi:hypothetical protein
MTSPFPAPLRTTSFSTGLIFSLTGHWVWASTAVLLLPRICLRPGAPCGTSRFTAALSLLFGIWGLGSGSGVLKFKKPKAKSQKPAAPFSFSFTRG